MSVYKVLGWSLVAVGGLLVLPFLVCMGDLQCVIVAALYWTPNLVGSVLFAVGGAVILGAPPDRRKKRTIFAGGLALLAILGFFAVPRFMYSLERDSCQVSGTVETVMSEGATIAATIDGETLNISAGPCYERTFKWSGGACTILEGARGARWNGSLGIYSPSAADWKPGSCGALEHAVVEEGQQHFSSVAEALAWVKAREAGKDFARGRTVYNRSGLVVSWWLQNGRILSAEVWQIYVNGVKPQELEGAKDANLRETR